MRASCLLVTFLLFLLCAADDARADFAGGEPATFALFSATEAYGGDILLETARSAAMAKAEEAALLGAMRTIAKQPVLAFIGSNDGEISFSPPSLEGLARKLCLLEPVRCDSDANVVTCTVKAAWPRDGDMRRDIPASLRETPLLDRYEAAARRRQALLSRYDRLTAMPDEKSKRKEEFTRLAAELDALHNYISSLSAYGVRWNAPSETLQQLENALHASPDAPLLLAGAAEALIQLGNPIKAHAMIDRAIDQEPDIAFFHDLEGTALLQQNLPSLAADAYGRAIFLAPVRGVYRAHRGYAFYLLGNEEAMCEDFRAACADGDCSGLTWSTGRGYCAEADTGEALPDGDNAAESGDGTFDEMGGGKSIPPSSPVLPDTPIPADARCNATQKAVQAPDVPETREEGRPGFDGSRIHGMIELLGRGTGQESLKEGPTIFLGKGVNRWEPDNKGRGACFSGWSIWRFPLR